MKYLKHLFICIILSYISPYNAQEITRASTKIEIIKRRIKAAKTDTTKIKLLQQWSDLVFISNPEKDLDIQQQVIDICVEHLKSEKIPYLQKWFLEQESMALDKTATSYYYEGEDQKALKFYTASSKILEDLANDNLLSIDNTYLLSTTCNKIARMYEGEGNFKNALNYYQKSMRLESEVQAQRAKQQNIQHVKDSILLVSSEIMHEKEISYQKEVTKKKERNLFYITCSLFVFLILFVLVLRSWRKTKSQNKIIENQKSDIESQKSKLEESHKEITDSINYAKNIQDALMTSSEYIKDALPESFVFFLPKDVVSGDYYWVYKFSEDEVFFTVADCTGHGVPGAFMSMIGTSLLNENIIDYKIDGIISCNTTVNHNDKNGKGGLSGLPLKDKATEKLVFIKNIVGNEIPIIASGGVMSVSDYLEKINAGADLVQVYTGLIFEGPKLIKDILRRELT